VHFGKGHDDNPPGRGSGRYAWGTGNGDGAKEKKRQKNLDVGRERLTNRVKVANTAPDKLAGKAGWTNTLKSGEANKRVSEVKKLVDEILQSEDRTASLGQHTRNIRIADIAITSTAGTILATAGSAAAMTALDSVAGIVVAPIAIGVAAKVGYDYYKKTTY
jgi:hypothetical protein